jgi:CheY-like chemotaxis protein
VNRHVTFPPRVSKVLFVLPLPEETKRSSDNLGKTASLRILIVEDEFFVALDAQEMVEALGHAVMAIAGSADQAVALVERHKPDVVLMDIRLNGARDGISAAMEIGERFDIKCIFITANADLQTRQRAELAGPVAILEKPVSQQDLQAALSKLANDKGT